MTNPIIAVGLIPDDGTGDEPTPLANSAASAASLARAAEPAPPANVPLDGFPADPVAGPRYSSWQLFGRAMRPSFKGSHLLAGLLCALLGFALVTQVRAASGDQLAGMRQEDLVRLLDEVSTRADQMAEEVQRLERTRDELLTGTNQAAAALEVARARAATEGILSGRLPAEGSGLILEVRDPDRLLTSADLFNVMEELRNAGAEAIQVNEVRVTTTSSFVDTANGVALDGNVLNEDLTWIVIGDPATMDRALEIPGGALPRLRSAGAETAVELQELVSVTATVELRDPEYARPVTQ